MTVVIAVAIAGEFVDAAMDEAMRAAAGDPVTGFQSFLEWWSGVLEAEDFQAGCPVLAVAAESHPEAPQLAAAAASAFGRWQHTMATALE
ncbi:MAG: TetR/AcrR family transcriptional regulator, partial [Actinomycetota bacterium]|nr:TetR/AcrR family transcriptional regulator [Actinomycetota bacterium]